jgi:DNA-binding GntR family transcriptional regulator
MRELSTITCLIIFLYDAPTATTCRADDHGGIVAAIAAGESAQAEALMLHHLDDNRAQPQARGRSRRGRPEAIFLDV